MGVIREIYMPTSEEAAVDRNLYAEGIALLNQWGNNSPYYVDLMIIWDDPTIDQGRKAIHRIFFRSQDVENCDYANFSVSWYNQPQATGIGDCIWLPPRQGYLSSGSGSNTLWWCYHNVQQVIEDGQVVWRQSSYYDQFYGSSYSGLFYRDSTSDGVIVFLNSTLNITYNDILPWVFTTWQTASIVNDMSTTFLNGLTKPSPYYITVVSEFEDVSGEVGAVAAKRLYFETDPGTVHFRNRYDNNVLPQLNGWVINSTYGSNSTTGKAFFLNNYDSRSNWVVGGLTSDWGITIDEYDPSVDSYNYSAVEPFRIHVRDSSVPFEFNGVVYLPSEEPPAGPKANYLFYKDNFLMRYGLRTLSGSDYWDGSSSPSPTGRGSDINCYYYTPKVDPVIRFTSPVTGEDYSVKVIDLDKNDAGFPVCEPNFKITNLNDRVATTFDLELFYNIAFGKPYIAEYRALQGSYNSQELIDATYSDMTELDHVNLAVGLGELVKHFRKFNPDFSSEDIFTTIYMDFVEYDTDNVIATKSLDYSSLLGSGIDVTTDDGSGDGEGTSWDPLPGHENDSTDPNYNPPATNRIDMNRPNLTPYGLFNRTYILNSTAVTQLGDILSTTDDSKFEAILEGLKMFGAKPMDALIDLRLYPFDVLAQIDSGGSLGEQIILGRYNTEIIGVIMRGNNCIIPLGSIFIRPKYNSFLDYEPYTTIRLYVPYIGTIELAPSIYMNKTLHVLLIVDFTTGAGTAVIYCNGIPMTYHSGVIGVSIPMTGDDASAYANGIIGNLVGAVGSAAGAIASAASGNAAGAVKLGANALEDLFEMGLGFNDVKFQLAGSASPSSANWLPQKCHIAIARPQLADLSPSGLARYGMTVGYATAYSTIINSLTPGGIYYGVLAAHTGAAATEPVPTAKEIEMIRERLNNGFYIGATT